MTTGAVVGATPSGADLGSAQAGTTSPLTGFTVQLGPEERVFGPSGLTDFPYFSERTPSGKLVGFISNNDSYRVRPARDGKLRDPKVILKRGNPGTFDKCGAWLIGSVIKKSPQRWMALYHAEAAGRGDNNRCIYNDDSVVASVGRAISNDGGKTWKKRGQVLTQDARLDGPKTEDATMGRVVRYGNYLYFFYGASAYRRGSTRYLHVARSSVADFGERGTWKKWHCYKPSVLAARTCGFGGTGNGGIGGKSNPVQLISPTARVIVPNTYLDHSIALFATGTRGFRLWVSNTSDTMPPLDPADPDSTERAWAGSVQIYPEVTHQDDRQVDNWNRTKRAKQLYAYPSIVGLRGQSHTSGRVFYIYYVKLFPGGDFPERYLMRRKVTLSPDDAGLNRVALTTYFDKKSGLRRTSTERPIRNAFRPKGAEGFLLGEPAAGFRDVFECVKNGDYLLRVGQCGTGERKYRRVGWISPTETTHATVPIFRCYNTRKKNHFASADRGCRGFKREVRLGYGLPSV
ncbi:hypothetical protein [Nocardioides pelophilus]|uniref:hypothetical protein n=1 Tax=Nocardioides pelophilus TaxID=2172019 RepID=UPI001603EB50|nr:hypothetical protein [Nocardioides pelophilus]